MHNAKVEKSPRLQNILNLLKNRGMFGATGMEICRICKATAVSTFISELRHCGYTIKCKFEATTDTGAKVYRYTLSF